MNSMTDQRTGYYAPATDPGSQAGETGESSLRAELDALKAQFANLVSKAGSDAMKAGSDAMKTAQQATSDVADKASDIASAATAQVKTFASELERIGRNNPLGALAGALLVGVVIGLIGRRH
jgi:ElaB/YqjD/DUF883 family membrane-anchored ribosome-binding protein